MYFHRDKKKQRVLPVFVFLILEDGGGKLVSVHMYIKSRRVTDQPLTADTLTVYACKQEKGYRIFLRTQTLPSHSNTVWNRGCSAWSQPLYPQTAATLPCFCCLAFHPSSFSEPAYSVQRARTGGREENSYPSLGDTVLKGRIKSKHFEKEFTQNKSTPLSESLRSSL